MKKKIIIIVGAILVIGGGIVAFLLWQSKPESVPEPVVAALPAQQGPPQMIVALPPEKPQLPGLNESDEYMLDVLSGLFNKESLLDIFLVQHIIRKIVATVDNLPRQHLPPNVVPVKRASGRFMVEAKEGIYTISVKNSARYSVYMKIVEMIEARKVVEAYVSLYPLFQKAYEELGYPGKYFNDCLLATIDNLLAAPEMKEPVRLVQPKVFYMYENTELESCSSGQKILMRIGRKNAAIIKDKLREIKKQIMLNLQEKKIADRK